jgi:heme/copper-type cytochrome/quinol oxidase subunit 4
MTAPQVNRISFRAAMVLSLIALLAALSGYTHPLLPDEGAAAHIFQLAIVALVPTLILFLSSADWHNPRRCLRLLAVPTTALVFAFVARYYLEHYH